MSRELSRRTFLAGAASTTLLMRGAFAQDKPVVLGEGKHKYEWVKGWAKLPEGKTFAPTHGCVQADSKDRIFVNTDNENAIMIFENDGTFVKSWGKDFKGGAHGFQIVKQTGEEFVLLAHTGRHEVIKLTLDGEVQMTIPWPEKAGVYKAAGEYKPTMAAAAPNGDIYVGDGYGKSWVHQFSAKGEYIRSWNAEKTKAGPMRTPHGVWIDLRGEKPVVVVADRGNGRLLTFTPEGELIDIVKEGLRMPCKVFIRGEDVLIPDLKGRVTILDKNNKLIAHLGENSNQKFQGNFGVKPEDWKEGEFTAPHGACWDSKGNMYVEDWNQSGRVNKLKRIA